VLYVSILAKHTRFSDLLPASDLAGSSFAGFDCDSLGGWGLDSFLVGSGFCSCLDWSGLVSCLGCSCLGCSCSPDGCDEVSWSLDAGSLGSSLASCLPPAGGSPPSSSLTTSCPTVTVSSSLTRNSLMVPAWGAFSETSILSVSMVAISSSCST
jgi:hypothetical protein